MMNIRFLKNHKGVTLVELIVAMAMSSLVMIFVVSGSLFVQNYLKQWKQGDLLIEELVLLQNELSSNIRSCKSMILTEDSVNIITSNGSIIKYKRQSGRIYKGKWNILRKGFKLTGLEIAQFPLPEITSDSILNKVVPIEPTIYYKMKIVISDQKGQSDTLECVIRNEYNYNKYSKKKIQT